MQSQGGIQTEHLKKVGLHTALGPDDRFFWLTDHGPDDVEPGGSGPAQRLYGLALRINSGKTDMNVLWGPQRRPAPPVSGPARSHITACMKADIELGRDFDLTPESIGPMGPPLPPTGFAWAHEMPRRTSGSSRPAVQRPVHRVRRRGTAPARPCRGSYRPVPWAEGRGLRRGRENP